MIFFFFLISDLYVLIGSLEQVVGKQPEGKFRASNCPIGANETTNPLLKSESGKKTSYCLLYVAHRCCCLPACFQFQQLNQETKRVFGRMVSLVVIIVFESFRSDPLQSWANIVLSLSMFDFIIYTQSPHNAISHNAEFHQHAEFHYIRIMRNSTRYAEFHRNSTKVPLTQFLLNAEI